MAPPSSARLQRLTAHLDNAAAAGEEAGKDAEKEAGNGGKVAHTFGIADAQALKTILRKLFHIPVFFYVDDLFFALPAKACRRSLDLARRIVSDMLGWPTDDSKSGWGSSLVVLGTQVTWHDALEFSLPGCSPAKAARNRW